MPISNIDQYDTTKGVLILLLLILLISNTKLNLFANIDTDLYIIPETSMLKNHKVVRVSGKPETPEQPIACFRNLMCHISFAVFKHTT